MIKCQDQEVFHSTSYTNYRVTTLTHNRVTRSRLTQGILSNSRDSDTQMVTVTLSNSNNLHTVHSNNNQGKMNFGDMEDKQLR